MPYFFLAAQYSQICLLPFTNAVGIPSIQGGKDVNHLKSFLPLAALMHILDFDKIVSELGVINQTDACVVLKRDQEAVG